MPPGQTLGAEFPGPGAEWPADRRHDPELAAAVAIAEQLGGPAGQAGSDRVEGVRYIDDREHFRGVDDVLASPAV